MKKVLSIAGSDCSGGAGIQADLKTFCAHGVYGMSAITALTAQNTLGVTMVEEASPEMVRAQLDAIFTDIVPDSVKIGMVSSSVIIEAIVEKLMEYQAVSIVLDPVMVSTSGSRLLNEEAMSVLIKKLMPLATMITPNLQEAECLCGFNIQSKEEMVLAAKKIASFYKGHILIKGGHLDDCADDLLYVDGEVTWFLGEQIENPNTHGTGCTLSSAITSNLALGYDVQTSVKNAKLYITKALKANLDLGHGRGPLNHLV